MTQTIIFHNPGQLDIRGATIMGLSAKDQDGAIGKFGTGLKYAIASILRWGGAISIETGGRKYEFEKLPLEFRGKKHEQVAMRADGENPELLGFTTHYGHEWKGWQVFRELYSNARDEGGSCFSSGTSPGTDRAVIGNYGADYTLIRVTCAEIAEAYAERDTILLPNPGELVVEDHPSTLMRRIPSNFLYYRGVRVVDQKSLFTWNLLDNVELTEDRSATYGKFAWSLAIGQVVQQSEDRDLIRKVITASERYAEGHADFSAYRQTSEAFLDVVEEEWRRNPKGVSGEARDVLEKKRKHVMMPDCVQPTKMQQLMIDKARRLLKLTDQDPDAFPLELRPLQKNTLGMAQDGTVILNPIIFEQGTKQVVSTWYEELLHLSSGLSDCNYEMQTHLFNRIISLYEEHVFGEPC